MIHLRGESADVVIDTASGVPTIVYWGAPLGNVDLPTLADALARPVVHGALDVVAPLSVVPEHAAGFAGRPGLLAHRRGGSAWAPRFAPAGVATIADGVVVSAIDPVAEVRLDTRICLHHALTVQCTLTNLASTRYLIDALTITLPLPAHASDLLTFTGRWTRELHAAREHWATGSRLIENRRGRTSHEHVPLLFAASRASANGAVRCGAHISRGAVITRCWPTACPTADAWCRWASCCTQANSPSNPASST